MTVEKLCINSKVKEGAVKRATVNGKEHFVVSSYLLVFDSILNGGLYSREQIEANYQKLEGTLAPAGHPIVDGKYVSAFSHEGIRDFHIGAYNRNVTIEGNRVHAEVWVDIEFAKNSKNPDGPELIQRLEQLEKGEGEPIGMSVAVWCERIMAEEGLPYQWIANIKGIDHNCVLLREQPAAPIESGVGMAVNQLEDAVAFNVNEAVFEKKTARQKDEEMSMAVREKFGSADKWAYPIDYSDDTVIIQVDGGKPMAYAYTTDNGKIQIDNTGKPVESKTIWQVVANAWRALNPFSQPQAAPAQQLEANEMAMTAEEQKALTEQISQALTANMSNVLKPLQDEVAELKANQKALTESLEANKKAEEAVKRAAVAEKFGEVVANQLSGAALDEMHSKLGDAASLAANAAQTAAAGEKFDQFPE